jgi:hypothetical protein
MVHPSIAMPQRPGLFRRLDVYGPWKGYGTAGMYLQIRQLAEFVLQFQPRTGFGANRVVMTEPHPLKPFELT